MSKSPDEQDPQYPKRIEPRMHEGLRLGKYTLIRPLGSGGMAQVWLAHEPLLESELEGATKVVALKMSADLLGANKELRDSLLTELSVSCLLGHSNIVQVFGAEIIHGILIIKLERVDGMDLGVLLESMRERQTEMSVEMVFYIIRAVCEGLNHAHTHRSDRAPMGVIHRDLSPHNVIISSAGEVKIMDFGIGKLIHDKTSGNHIRGKPRYMAPEHAEGKAGPQADIFSVGAILFEALEGRPFRQPQDSYAMLAAAATLPAPPLRRTDLPPLVHRIYARATAHDLRERYANVAEFLRDLAELEGHEVRAQDMRTFYERQFDRGRHTGYTMSSIAVPEGFYRLVEAIKAANASEQRAGNPADDPQLQAAQRQALAAAKQARWDGPEAPRHSASGAEADAPSLRRRSSGLGGPSPEPPMVSTTVDRPPLHLLRQTPPVATAASREPEGKGATALLHRPELPEAAAPPTAILDRPAPRGPRAPSEPVWDPTGQTPIPVAAPAVVGEGTMFLVTGPDPRRMRIALASAGGVAVALAMVVGWMFVREPEAKDVAMGDATSASSTVMRASEPAAAELPDVEPSGPILDPIEPPREPAAAVAGSAVSAPAAEPVQPAEPRRPPEPSQPSPKPELPTAEPAMDEPVSAEPADPPKTSAKRKPAKKKDAIEVRLAPNFAEGEIKIGKRSWVVRSTFDVAIVEGRHSLAWRPDASSAWQSAGQIVLVPGLRYFVKLGKGGLSVSSSPAKVGSK